MNEISKESAVGLSRKCQTYAMRSIQRLNQLKRTRRIMMIIQVVLYSICALLDTAARNWFGLVVNTAATGLFLTATWMGMEASINSHREWKMEWARLRDYWKCISDQL